MIEWKQALEEMSRVRAGRYWTYINIELVRQKEPYLKMTKNYRISYEVGHVNDAQPENIYEG